MLVNLRNHENPPIGDVWQFHGSFSSFTAVSTAVSWQFQQFQKRKSFKKK